MFLGVERKETLWPFLAMSLESSKYGIMWPKASHGNITMCNLPSSAMDVKLSELGLAAEYLDFCNGIFMSLNYG